MIMRKRGVAISRDLEIDLLGILSISRVAGGDQIRLLNALLL